jgi:hypothetical protein
MVWGLVGAIGGALISSRAQKSAAKSQERSAERGIEEQRRQFDLTFEATEPYRDVGTAAVQDLAGLSGFLPGFYESTNRDRAQTRRGLLDRLGNITGMQTSRFDDIVRRGRQSTANIAGLFAGRTQRATDLRSEQARDIGQQYIDSMRGARRGMFDSADAVRAREFEADPGYQFRLSEGQKALERSAAARGNVLGAATQKNLTRFGQNLASDEFERFDARRARDYGTELGRAYQTLQP